MNEIYPLTERDHGLGENPPRYRADTEETCSVHCPCSVTHTLYSALAGNMSSCGPIFAPRYRLK